LIVGLVLAELAVLAAGFVLRQPYLGAVVAAGLVFVILAYRSPGFAWLLVWLAAPFSVERMIPGGHALYLPAEPMIALALIAWIARVKVSEPMRLPRSRLHAPLAVLAGITLLSVVLGGHVALGVKAWIVGAGYVSFAYLYCCLTQSKAPRAERWIPWVVGAGAFWGVYGTCRVTLEGFSYHGAYGVARPFFTEHGAYAAYLAMILPLAVLLTLARRGSARILYGGASLLMTLGVLSSLTRAAWVSLAIVIPPTVGLWLWRQRSLKPVAWIAGLAALAFVALAGAGAGSLISRHAWSVAAESDPSNLERLNRWAAAIEMARDRPWLGVGFGAYEETYPEYRRKTIVTELAYQRMSPHSEPMRLLSETGVPGFLAACWFVGIAFLVGFRAFRRSPERDAALLSLALVAALGTYVVHSVFRTYIDLEKIHVPFWATLGLLAALGRRVDGTMRAGARAESAIGAAPRS